MLRNILPLRLAVILGGSVFSYVHYRRVLLSYMYQIWEPSKGGINRSELYNLRTEMSLEAEEDSRWGSQKRSIPIREEIMQPQQ